MVVPLEYHLNAQGSYVQGKPVIIGFSIENISSSYVWILRWYTPLEGIKGKIFEMQCDGMELLYEGRLVKRGNPELSDYICIHPGKTVHTEFDLSNVYSLPVCQECHLRFKGQIHDVVFVQQQVPRSTDQHVSVDIPGNSISFRITRE